MTSGHLDSLVRARVLLDSPPLGPKKAGPFTAGFHQANVDYPFFDYGSPEVTENESNLLDRYAGLWPPPPAVLEREGPRYPLPVCDADLGLVPAGGDGRLTLGGLAWVLKLVLAPIDEIKTRHVTCVRRTTPSGGARHPTELAVVLPVALGEVPGGTYTYDISTHSLVAEPFAVHEAYTAGLGQRDIGFVIRSRVDRAMWRYRDLRALRPLLIDAGHVTELVAYLFGRLAMSAEVISAPVAPGRPSWLLEPEVVMVRVSRFASPDQSASSFPPPSQADGSGESGAFLTNPAMVLRFVPALSASVIWPASAHIALSLDEFLVLNHCLPSTRGDRDQTMPGIVKAVPGADGSAIERLAACGGLLPVAEAAPLYDDLRLWVRHEWYLAFLAYAEALERGAAFPVASRAPASTSYLADTAALFQRRTSRFFAPEPVRLTAVKDLLSHVAQSSWWPDLEISVATWNIDGLAPGLYRWCDGNLMQRGEVPPRELVAANCAGQTATSSGALAIWLSALSDPGHPGQYLMDLVDLGRLGQRICMAATELGVATFLSPAVCDRPTCSMLGIGQAERRITYVFGLGSPASPQSASTKSSVAE